MFGRSRRRHHKHWRDNVPRLGFTPTVVPAQTSVDHSTMGGTIDVDASAVITPEQPKAAKTVGEL